MAEEILNKNVGDAVVTSQVVDTAPTPRKRGRKPGAHKKQAQPVSAAQQPVSKVNGHQPIWLSTVVNLVLLIAIFTIILATHRAIQNSRHVPEVVKTETVENVAVTASEQAPVEITKPVEQVAVAEVKEEKSKEPVCDPAVSKRSKRPIAKRSAKKLPFADLDLSKNPWNNGGEQDLDNGATRQEYKKSYLSSTGPDNK